MAAQDPWPGLATDPSPHSSGARVSENCRALRPGIMSGRGGCRDLWFENNAARSPAVTDITALKAVISLAVMRRPEGDYVVFLESDGTLRAGRRPT